MRQRRPNAGWRLLTLFIAGTAWVLTGCGEAQPPIEEPEQASFDTDYPRTADPVARGYTDDVFPRVQEIAPGVYTYEQLRSAGDEQFTTVSLFVVGEGSVLVADGQGSVEETQRLVDHIRERTDAPIQHVVIASDHGDHTAGNSAFPQQAAFYAHPTSAEALRSRRESAQEGTPPIVEATHLVPDQTVLDVGGREVHIRFMGRAHTGGDLVVHLPAEGVVFMSEAYLHRVFPAMRSAFPSEWVSMIERVKTLGAEVIVPGHGFVDPPEILKAELDSARVAIEQVIAEGARLHESGRSVDQAIEEADFGSLEQWSLRSSQGPTAIRRVYMELNDQLPPP